MLEHYSSRPMPSPEVRKRYLLEYFKNELKYEVNDIVLKAIEKVIATTPEFSSSGYFIFGIKQERDALKNELKIE